MREPRKQKAHGFTRGPGAFFTGRGTHFFQSTFVTVTHHLPFFSATLPTTVPSVGVVQILP